jgi:hypothetical protein
MAANKRGKGRPPKLAQRVGPGTEVTYGDRIVQALDAGAFFDDACAFAGVSRSAAYEWLARGKAAREEQDERGEAHELSANDRLYLDFADAVEKTRATVVVRNLAIIRSAAQDGTWQAAAWYLERTQPGKYGRHQRSDEAEPELTTDAARAKLLGLDLGTESPGG